MHALFFASLIAAVAATPSMMVEGRDAPAALSGPVDGVATFNNYGKEAKGSDGTCGPQVAGQSAQCGQNCPSREMSGPAKYLAAVGDLSKNLTGVKCPTPPKDSFKCQGSTPLKPDNSPYAGPHCDQTNCKKCYKVTNKGGESGQTDGVGRSVYVGVVDACPSASAQNSCKADVKPRDKCAEMGTNAMDIDLAAYKDLTGLEPMKDKMFNLNISIEEC